MSMTRYGSIGTASERKCSLFASSQPARFSATSSHGCLAVSAERISASAARNVRASAATPYGVGCGNAAPLTLTPTSSAVPGQSITARVTNTPTLAAFIGFGLSDVVSSSGLPLPFDLSPVGMTGCTLYQSNDIFGLPTTSAGVPFERLFALPLPSNPLLVGREAFIQAFSFAPLANPYGFLASNGVRYRLGNL